MKNLPLVIFLLLLFFVLVSSSDAQEIKFETADGKFKITGTVGYFVSNGQPVTSPNGDEKDLAVVIVRSDGVETKPVPIKLLSSKTQRILFEKPTPASAIAPFDNKTAKIHQRAWADHLDVPVESTNSVGMKFTLIPPGEFTMGTDNPGADNSFDADEAPAHKVTITKPFRLGVHEVTRAQYAAVVNSDRGESEDSTNPIAALSWPDAVAFCKQLSKLPEEKAAGRTYRLPTEAEWEYACRAGTTTNYFFGDDSSGLSDYAWFNGNSGSKTHPVGLKKPNSWGLHDIYGNVSEYCQDGFGNYSKGSATNPKGLRSGRGEIYKVVRGGHYGHSGPDGCRSADRMGCHIGHTADAPATQKRGLRVVCLSNSK